VGYNCVLKCWPQSGLVIISYFKSVFWDKEAHEECNYSGGGEITD